MFLTTVPDAIEPIKPFFVGCTARQCMRYLARPDWLTDAMLRAYTTHPPRWPHDIAPHAPFPSPEMAKNALDAVLCMPLSPVDSLKASAHAITKEELVRRWLASVKPDTAVDAPVPAGHRRCSVCQQVAPKSGYSSSRA